MAKEGIEGIVSMFARDHEFRTDFVFVIARGTTAENVMRILTPLEPISAIDLYSSLEISEKSWAPAKSIRIVELINAIYAEGMSPLIAGVQIQNETADSGSTDALKYSRDSARLKFTSLGALQKDKLVGWLDEDESKGFNYIAGDVKETVGFVNYGDDVRIAGKILSAESDIKAVTKNGKVEMHVTINADSDIESVVGKFDGSKEENKKIIEQLFIEKITNLCEKSIQKARDLGTDIFGFGKPCTGPIQNSGSDERYWDTVFRNIPVILSVSFEISQMGQINKPVFLEEQA